jgi:hypothetical protein
MQYQIIVASVGVGWPALLEAPLQAVAWVWSGASPETLAPDCLLRDSSDSGGSLAVKRVMFYVLAPLAMLCVLVMVEVLSAFAAAAGSARSKAMVLLPGRILATALVVLFLFLPSLCRTAFSLFACIRIDAPAAAPYAAAAVGWFSILDTNASCFADGWHGIWALALGLPLLLLVCVALPVFIVVFTVRHSHGRVDKNRVATKQAAAFLSKSYRDACCFWEGVSVTQTIILVCISVFGPVALGALHRNLVMNAALALIVGLLAVVKPYADGTTGRVYLQAMGCVWLTSYASMSFIPIEGVDQTAMFAYSTTMGAVVLLVNAAFVVSLLWRLQKLLQLKQGLKALLLWIGVKLGCARMPVQQKDVLAESVPVSNDTGMMVMT